MPETVVFDLETTGVNVKKDRIVQIAAVKIDENFVELGRLVLDINPTVPIPQGASRVHGIYDKDVRNCKTFKGVADAVVLFFDGCDLAGYNIITFDIPLLEAELQRCGRALNVSSVRVFDAFAVFRKLEKGVKGKKLTDAFRHYCEEELGDDAHDAFADTMATTAILEAQVERYRCTEGNPISCLGDMHDLVVLNKVDLGGRFCWNESGDAVIDFGKHAGMTLQTLCTKNIGYAQWILNGKFSEEAKGLVRAGLRGVFPVRPKKEAPKGAKKTKKMKPLWHYEDCTVCGTEGLATRARDVPIDEKYVCNECEMLERGAAGGRTEVRDALLEEISDWMAWGHELRERVKRTFDNKIDGMRLTGTNCSVCGKPQYESPGGVTCENGHGGAPAKEDG